MRASILWVAVALATVSSTAQAGEAQEPGLRFWGVDERVQGHCSQSELSQDFGTAILEQLEAQRPGTQVFKRPATSRVPAGCCSGPGCAAKWTRPASAVALSGPAESSVDPLLGGFVEKVSGDLWRGRLWLYGGRGKNMAVRDVWASRQQLPYELAYAAAALVLAPDMTRNEASAPTYCAAPSTDPPSADPATTVYIDIYHRPSLDKAAQTLADNLKSLSAQLGVKGPVVTQYPKPLADYAACTGTEQPPGRPRKPLDCPPQRSSSAQASSAQVLVELDQGNDRSGQHPTSPKKVRLSWRSAHSQQPLERTLRTSSEQWVAMVTEALRPKLAGLVDSPELSLGPQAPPLPKESLLCVAFSKPEPSPIPSHPSYRGTRIVITAVLSGLAAVSLGLFIWRAGENNKPVAGDCSLPGDPSVTIVDSCNRKTWPTMLATGLPTVILSGVAAGILPWGQDAPPAATPPDTESVGK